MTHFSVLVIGTNIEDKLAPYDEILEVEPYIKLSEAELEEQQKEMIGKAKNPPQDSSFDYSPYAKKMCLAEFVPLYHASKIEENNNMPTIYNPQSKWDWFEIGGRWNGMLTTKSGIKANQATFGKLALNEKDFNTYAVITEDGLWHALGDMGWGANSSESEEWKQAYRARFIKGLFQDTLLTVVDCHI